MSENAHHIVIDRTSPETSHYWADVTIVIRSEWVDNITAERPDDDVWIEYVIEKLIDNPDILWEFRDDMTIEMR